MTAVTDSRLTDHPTRTPSPPWPTPPGSTRRRLGSLVATGLVLAALAAGLLLVAATVSRLTTGAALQPLDGFSVVTLVISAVTACHLRRQTGLMRRLPLVPAFLQTWCRRVVEISAFGVGPVRDWTTTNPEVGLDRVTEPGPEVDHGSEQPDESLDRLDARASKGPGRSRPRPEPQPRPRSGTGSAADEVITVRRRWGRTSTESSPSLATFDLASLHADGQAAEIHVVARGETFWSLAETHLGDGRHWTVLRDLNLGRDVAPGTRMTESSVLRQGWKIAVPKRQKDD